MSRTNQSKANRPKIKRRSNRNLLIGGVVLAVVLALGAAIILSGGDGTPELQETAAVTITGPSLPAFAGNPANDLAVGLEAPALSGVGFDGSAVDIPADGRPKVILFLAHWCPHCQNEVPVLQTYQNETGFPETVDFYSVATSSAPTNPNWPPSAWLEREGWTFPVLVDDQRSSAYAAFGGGSFPYFVLIDGNGRVALRLIGEIDPVQLASYMEQLG